MSPPARDPREPHELLGVPVGAHREQVAIAFRDAVRPRLAHRDEPTAACEIIALQQAYWAVVRSATSDPAIAMPVGHKLMLAGGVCVALAIFPAALWVFEAPRLGLALFLVGSALLFTGSRLRARGRDPDQILEADVLELLAVRTPQHEVQSVQIGQSGQSGPAVQSADYEMPFSVEAPAAGVRLEAAIGLYDERGSRRVLLSRGAPLPCTLRRALRLESDGLRAFDLRLFAFDTPDDEGREVHHVRAHAPRPLHGDEVILEIAIGSSGRLVVAAHDSYAGRALRMERVGEPEGAVPVGTCGYRG
jgi:type IV secretory pathway TrbD component